MDLNSVKPDQTTDFIATFHTTLPKLSSDLVCAWINFYNGLNVSMNIYNDKPCKNVSVKTLKLTLAFPCSLAPISIIMLQLPDFLYKWDFIDNVQRTDVKTFFFRI